ncbi:MAG TPA: PP2C family protein-serine/threonine phosphatase [Anaerolineales bacterium]|nr:PP2C family protein-serine/threonine phosphatase [Anaerolineales bacterium]
MNDIFYRLANKLRPDLGSLGGQQRISATADVLTLLYTSPLALIGLVWLIYLTNWESIRAQWQLYLLLGVILYIFNRLRFFFITEIRTGGYANSDGAMDGIVVWAAVLLLGPTALWLKVLWNTVILYTSIRRERTVTAYWSRGRMFTADVASDLLATLVALLVYRWVGGVIPIPDYSFHSITPALLAVLVQYAGSVLVYSGYISYIVWSLRHVLHTSARPAIIFFATALSLPVLANPFGILVAGIYTREGLVEFFFILIGLLLTAILARRLSMALEYSRQQSRQIEQLEKLGRAILDTPPDGSQLPTVLQNHVTSMFSSRLIMIWTTFNGLLLQEPAVTSTDWQLAWQWLKGKNEPFHSMPGGVLPWNPGLVYSGPIILCPIKDVEGGQSIGEIFIELQTMTIPWDERSVRRQLPAVQSLAAQVASAIHQAHVYAGTLAIQKTLQELALAHSIQASFLPESIPQIPGWQLSATLEPARQIAGDFYDFIHLPDNRLGILIADVADKGLGSALYMALSSTLIRTFANEYHRDPARVLKTANQHILRNARANLFVTVFFGVLDPATGLFRYANAGHNPPYIFSPENGIKTLSNTGMPLGIDEENNWGQNEIVISPGEMLLMYTDGVTDAQDIAGQFIDRKVILSALQQNIGKTVQEVQDSILNTVHHFVGDAPRFDDLTLVILGREKDGKN